MAKFVPYLAEEAIERNAEALLTEFAHARDVVIEPPIPIEDIMEKYLKLGRACGRGTSGSCPGAWCKSVALYAAPGG